MLSSFDGFIPAHVPDFKKLPDPTDPVKVGGRCSDEQLYALAPYIYSLKPSPNPNKFAAAAARGKQVFANVGCSRCHTAPLWGAQSNRKSRSLQIDTDNAFILTKWRVTPGSSANRKLTVPQMQIR
jgi:cytochrome c553